MAASVKREILRFHRDDEGDWVAELSCGHGQHVRHRPPFQLRAWVEQREGRAARIGTALDCPLCDRAELPERARPTRSMDRCFEVAGPAGPQLLEAPCWQRIVVVDGAVRVLLETTPRLEVLVSPGSSQVLPPRTRYLLEALEPVKCRIESFAIDQATAIVEEGGDPACWAGLICPECGRLVTDPVHQKTCDRQLEQ